MPRPTLLLVHGAWHGSWFWEPLRAELASEAADGSVTHLVGGHSAAMSRPAEVAAVVRGAAAS